MSEDTNNREWQHAACLSIAEGAPGWDQDFGDRASEAMRAVQKLQREFHGERATRGALRVRLDHANAERGEVRARVGATQSDGTMEAIERIFAERDAALAQAECDRLMLVAALVVATGEDEGEAQGPAGRSPADRIREYVGGLRAERDALRAAVAEVVAAYDAVALHGGVPILVGASLGLDAVQLDEQARRERWHTAIEAARHLFDRCAS